MTLQEFCEQMGDLAYKDMTDEWKLEEIFDSLKQLILDYKPQPKE